MGLGPKFNNQCLGPLRPLGLGPEFNQKQCLGSHGPMGLGPIFLAGHVYFVAGLVCLCHVCSPPSDTAHPSITEATVGRLHTGARMSSAATPLCGFLYMGLSMGTGSCIWDARPAMCGFAYGFPNGSEH